MYHILKPVELLYLLLLLYMRQDEAMQCVQGDRGGYKGIFFILVGLRAQM